MKIVKGIYKTKAGSIVKFSGRYAGINEVKFYWSKEMNACKDCNPNTHPEWDGKNIVLTWTCENCGGGKAILLRTTEQGTLDDRLLISGFNGFASAIDITLNQVGKFYRPLSVLCYPEFDICYKPDNLTAPKSV